jgi:[ribosomal protein S5]-alanine N-acetyltransferase
MHGARAVDAFATARLTIVPATPELVDLELTGADRLAEALRADLPDDWPPEHHDGDVLRFVRATLDEPSADGWWLHYLVLDEEGGRVLVGTAGFKGPPAEGVVEIGYSVVASRRRRGIATEACQALIERAWSQGADVVLAHTLPELEPSIGVLRKLGFETDGEPQPGVLRFALRRG